MGTLPGYVLHERVGAGAAAEVLRAEPVGSPGRVVAVKRLRVDAPAGAVTELLREGDALARLAHPSILRVLEVVQDGPRVALVLPFAPGGTLAQRLATVTGGLPPVEVADLGARLGRALAAAHDAGLVHRDVKPTNVLFDAEGQPLLADFGTARLTEEVGPVAGTAEYVDPAALARGAVDARSDVYGLGATLYEALAGVPPYAGQTPQQTLAAADRGVHVPLHELVDAPPALSDAVERALARDPDDRFPTAAMLASHLDEARRELEATGATAGPPPVPDLGGQDRDDGRPHRAGVLGAVPAPDERRRPRCRRPDPAPERTDAAADHLAVPAGADPVPAPERSGTRTFGPAPPAPAAAVDPAGRSLRPLLIVAAALAVLLPVGLVWWLVSDGPSDEVAMEEDGPTATDEPGAGEPGGDDPAEDDAMEEDAATSAAPAAERLPACDDTPTPAVSDADATVLTADVDGRGCTVPVVWDGSQLHVPLADGEVARYDLAADPDDVLLFGDWSCDGAATPALYRPGDGQLFVFDTLAEDTTVQGTPTGIVDGDPAVVRDDDGCERVEVQGPG